MYIVVLSSLALRLGILYRNQPTLLFFFFFGFVAGDYLSLSARMLPVRAGKYNM